MNKSNKYHKFDVKNKKKNFVDYQFHKEDQLSLKETKRDIEHKHFRNYANVLKSKDIDTLMQYHED